jgi:UDP-N-acetylmuramoyl-tripeptide--D-alanyl-D-alanine ligase
VSSQNIIRELYEEFVQFPFICTDTRKMVPNALFFCMKGENFDGNLFVQEALQKGARYVVCEMKYETKNMRYETREDHKSQISNLRSHIFNPMIPVDNVLQTLQQLAHYHRTQLKIPIIGITGTNGKTTTKELIAAVLSKKLKTAFTKGNLNNHIGVPLTLLSIKNDDEIAVIEMGANHPGEIAGLCTIAQPDYGLITNIGKAHLEGFGTIENIIETKTALYRAADVLFVNEEDDVLVRECKKQKAESRKRKAIFYGKNTDFYISAVEMNPCLAIDLLGRKVQTQLTGNYNLPNILAAATIGRYFGVTDDDICNAIAEYVPQNNRSQIIKTGTNTIIADYYNANPTSMKAALDNFLKIDAPNKLAILGDMLELGEQSLSEHQAIIDICESKNMKTIFIGTNFFTHKNQHSLFFMNIEECNIFLQNQKIDNFLILLKGSRGVQLEKIAVVSG